jgi:hypothetical protein
MIKTLRLTPIFMLIVLLAVLLVGQKRTPERNPFTIHLAYPGAPECFMRTVQSATEWMAKGTGRCDRSKKSST